MSNLNACPYAHQIDCEQCMESDCPEMTDHGQKVHYHVDIAKDKHMLATFSTWDSERATVQYMRAVELFKVKTGDGRNIMRLINPNQSIFSDGTVITFKECTKSCWPSEKKDYSLIKSNEDIEMVRHDIHLRIDKLLNNLQYLTSLERRKEVNMKLIKSLIEASKKCVRNAQTQPTSPEFKDAALQQLGELLAEVEEELNKEIEND